MGQLVLCLGSHKTDTKVLAGLGYFLGGLWKNPLPNSFRKNSELGVEGRSGEVAWEAGPLCGEMRAPVQEAFIGQN